MSEVHDPKVAEAIAEARQRNEESLAQHRVVSQDEWLRIRLNLMEKEKESFGWAIC